MKRHRPFAEDTASTSEKYPRSLKSKNVRSGNIRNLINLTPSVSSPEVVDIKERIIDHEVNGELPSLNEPLENNIASTSSKVIDHKMIISLEETNIKLKEELSNLKVKQERFEKKENTIITQALAETKEHYRRAKDAKIKVDELEDELRKLRNILTTKESQRIQLLHHLHDNEIKLLAKEEEITHTKKLFNDNRTIRENTQKGANLENELRQMIAVKDKTINGLHQKLEKAYNDLENQKDETREIEVGKQLLENRIAEVQEASRIMKEKKDALSDQIEELQNEIGQQKTDYDQLFYENQCERETFEMKLLQSRDAINKKNEEIAELRKKLDVQEVLYSEQVNTRIDVTESKAKNLENQYIQTRAELHELQVKYDDLQKQRAEAIEENSKMLLKKDEKIFHLKKTCESFDKRYRSDKERFSDAKREIEKLKTDKANLRFEMKKKEDINSSSQRHLENAHQEIQKLQEHLKKANEELNELKTKDEKNAKNTSNIVQLLKEVNEIRELLNSKDQTIADLQKQKDENEILLTQTLNDLTIMQEKVNELQKVNDNLGGQIAELMKTKEEALMKVEAVKMEKDFVVAQKQRLENELSETQKTLQSVVTELVEEKAEHEKAKECLTKSKEFVNKAMSLKNDETVRADEATARLATFEVQYLQNQAALTTEQEQRVHLQTQLLNLQQQISDVEKAKETAVKEMENRMARKLVEMPNLEKKLKHLQKKYSEIQKEMEDERRKHKILDGEYKRLATSNAEAQAEIEKHKSKLSVYEKMAVSKNTELEKLCDESHALLQKFNALSKK